MNLNILLCCFGCRKKYIVNEFILTNEILGKGKFGIVIKGILKDEHNKQVAIKQIPKKYYKNVELNCLILLKKKSHDSIIKYYNHYFDSNYLYIIMEFFNGIELFYVINEIKYLCEIDSKNIIYNLLNAVNHLHSIGIVHRDIKIENILCNQQTKSIKLIDFGLSKIHDINSECICNTIVGTPNYIAPEVFCKFYNNKCDIWACGIVLYIILYGYYPFYGDTDKELKNEIIKGQCDFDTDNFKDVSYLCINIIKKLLIYDYKSRPSAIDILKEKWFI